MKPYTKYNSINNNNDGLSKRMISPNQIKKNINNVETIKQQLTSPIEDNKSNEKYKYVMKTQNQKSKMINENEEKSKIIGVIEKNVNNRSKDKKDYITANIAKLTRKKDQKRNDSVNSKRSIQQKSQKGSKDQQQPIYVTKYDVKTKRINQQYANKQNKQIQQKKLLNKSNSNSNNQSIKQSQRQSKESMIQSQQPSIQYHYNQSNIQQNQQIYQYANPSSIYNQSRSKPYNNGNISNEDKNYKKKQIRNDNQYEAQNYHQNYNTNSRQYIEGYIISQNQKSSSNITIPQNKKIMTQASRIQYDLQKQYQQKFIQELTLKLKNQRQEFSLKLHKLEKDKQIIQSKNTKLIESQFQLKNELQFTMQKNGELQRELQKMRQITYKNGMDIQKTNNNNDRMFKQLQIKYNQLLMQYRGKIKQNADLSILVNQNMQKYEEVKNLLKRLQQELNLKDMQMANMKKVQQLKINQFKQKYQFLIKQKEIKSQNSQIGIQKQYQNVINQLQRQLNIKNQEIQTLIQENQSLYQRSKNKEQLQSLLESKTLQNNNFIFELNKNKKLINEMLNKHGEQVVRLSQELQQKERAIQKLNLNIEQIYRSQKMNKLSINAKNQLYGQIQNNQTQIYKGKTESQSAFEQMIYRQTQDSNKFKEELYLKADQIYQLKLEIDQLRQKVRRLEQDAQVNARTYASNINNLRQAKQATQIILKKRIAALQAMKTL